jgi:hypothetical protein
MTLNAVMTFEWPDGGWHPGMLPVMGVMIVFSAEQATQVMLESYDPIMLLCIDVPRVKYCGSLYEAITFYQGE